MPEGHSVHRIARQFDRVFTGEKVSSWSPQGRFAEGAAVLNGRTVVRSMAVGKHLFLEFAAPDSDPVWLHVHLGMYGAWDFAGDVTRKLGQTGEYSRRDAIDVAPPPVIDQAGEDSLTSIGAPRRTRIRMAEGEKEEAVTEFPPEPVGAVRVRLQTESTVADLRGPTACEVLTSDGVQQVLHRLGPDPLVDRGRKAEERFVDAVLSRRTPIGQLLMDQKIVSGIGNVYRAELLFRAGVNPHTPGRELRREQVEALWKDWTKLLKTGVEVGQMMTMDGLRGKKREQALRNRDDRHWVYHRAGLPCRVCGTHIVMEDMQGRNLFWCPSCQA